MKKIIIVITSLLVAALGFSQDVIILRKNKVEIKTKVSEITDTTIKYKKWDNIDGPLYNVQISAVSMIKYANGQQEIFDDNISSEDINNQKTKITESSKNAKVTTSKQSKLVRNDVPYYFNGQTNEIIELESAECSSKRAHTGAWGHVTIKSIQGIASNIKVSKQNIQFRIQLSDPKANPNAICELNVCEILGQRQFVYSKEGAHGKIKQNGIEIEFKKLDETGLYLITPSKNLSKGEYFFSIIDQDEAFAFSVEK